MQAVGEQTGGDAWRKLAGRRGGDPSSVPRRDDGGHRMGNSAAERDSNCRRAMTARELGAGCMLSRAGKCITRRRRPTLISLGRRRNVVVLPQQSSEFGGYRAAMGERIALEASNPQVVDWLDRCVRTSGRSRDRSRRICKPEWRHICTSGTRRLFRRREQQSFSLMFLFAQLVTGTS